MSNILVNDFKSNKLRNLAIMKLSQFHKTVKGDYVFLNTIPEGVTIHKAYFSVVFDFDIEEAVARIAALEALGIPVEVGGGAWDKYIAEDKDNIVYRNLPPEVEACAPDYDLYTFTDIYPRVCGGVGSFESKALKAYEILDSSIKYSTKGCPRKCGFCDVHRREGKLHQWEELTKDLNPRSDLLFLLDNNFTADPLALSKLAEIKRLGLTIEITQGFDIRLMTDTLAEALASVKHRRSLHYSYDLAESKAVVLKGIATLSRYVKAYRHKCYMLVGYDTTFIQDMARYLQLRSLGVDPYVMIYRGNDRVVDEKESFPLADVRLEKFARWVNGYFGKKFSWDTYTPWINAQAKAKEEELEKLLSQYVGASTLAYL